MSSGDPIQVEVWSDVVCPWCFIGKRRLERAIDALAADSSFESDVEVVYRPFQLDPGAPRGTAEPVADVYARKFGGRQRAAELMARVTSAAAEEGLDFHLDRAVRANTADAHRLLSWALECADSTVQAALKESLMLAYFSEGADIGDHDVLADRAGRCGLDPERARSVLGSQQGAEALETELRRAADNDITAVPTYVLDGRWAVPGAQDAALFEQVIRRLAGQRARLTGG